jgi:magnesium chelatase family protein
MLVAAMNPCPCGYFGDPERDCTCSLSTVTRYQRRISGPLLDRIDIHVEVPRVEFEKLADDRAGEPSGSIRERVISARGRQGERFQDLSLVCNAEMGPGEVRQFCRLDDEGRMLVRQAMSQLLLSARAFHRVLKLARSIADLAGESEIAPTHLAEALQYRPRRWG